MGLAPISDKRLQIWVLNEINKSANHRNTHMLTTINNTHRMSKQTMMTGQLMHRILTDNKCTISSGIVYEYNSDVLKRMPIYERMAWLTSDINEINALYPGESRSISPRFKTIHFIAVDQHETNDGIIESYDVDFGQYGGQYRNHAFHPGRLDENIARDNQWHDINEYQGAAQTMSTLKRRYTQMLDYDPQLKATLAYTKEHMDDGYAY